MDSVLLCWQQACVGLWFSTWLRGGKLPDVVDGSNYRICNPLGILYSMDLILRVAGVVLTVKSAKGGYRVMLFSVSSHGDQALTVPMVVIGRTRFLTTDSLDSTSQRNFGFSGGS